MKIHSEKVKSEIAARRQALKARMYRFVLSVIKVIDSLPKDHSNQIIGDQLLRAATSITANYIEAEAASSKKDFTNFFHHALKSANETKFWLALLRDSGKSAPEHIDPLLNEARELSNILAKSIITLKGKT